MNRTITVGALMVFLCSTAYAQDPPDAEPDPLAELNAAMREAGVVETIHGMEVADPYRALEEDNAATWSWVDAQTAHTLAYFETHANAERATQIEALLSIGYFGDVALAGDRVFFTKREGDAEQPTLYVDDGTDAGPRVLVDPNTLGERIAIDWFFPSPGGTYVAYGLSSDGSEESTLYVLECETGQNLTEEIPQTKWVDLSWLNDETGFYYTRYPLPSEPDYEAENENSYNRHLFFHALGSAYVDDPLVFRSPDPTDFVSPEVSDDDAFVVVAVFKSWSQSDLYVIDRQQPEGEPTPVVVGDDYLLWGRINDDQLYLFSNQDHSRGRILRAPLETMTDVSTWAEIISEGDGTIESFVFAGETLLVYAIEDISARLKLYAHDGTPLGEIELPTAGNVGAVGASHDSERIVFLFDSFFHPPTAYSYDAGVVTELDTVSADFDRDAFQLRRETVTSADGTEVNLFLVHRADMAWDGNQAVLLNGYGGFNVSMTPGFQRNVLYWLAQGGVFAVANIRGGGEFGEEWHRDGMLENKTHTFEDFEAAIRWLTESGLSSPERIAIVGGSNGGLLMGAMLTRCPDAFRAAVSSVGLYDMVRFSQFPPAEIWMGEYGDPSIAEEFATLLEYSPYHNVVEGTAYPAVLVLTADHDNRVSWQHSTKFAAYLQDATSSPNVVLFFMDRGTGHGAGTGVSDIVEEYVQRYTFIETELGVR